ncbi:MAG: transglutaminase-like domain-containing protein [Verrucomicrobiota bacterium]|nr:transglutaminase-like domain-containing protein [Verrucomicrobiota bacterium]
MNSSLKIQTQATPSEAQRAALISLLADDDAAVYQTVREKLLSYGPMVSAWLHPYLLNNDPVLRRRAQNIVDHFARQNADTQFLVFCLKQGEEFDVEEGAWLLTKTQYPNINTPAYAALMDSFAGDLRERMNRNVGAEQIVAVINEYLFAELGFAGNEENYYDPDNSYLNAVLDRRTGNPLSLCLIYLMLAKRLQLPMTGIGLPGHFICRFQSSTSELFVDAFNRGKLLSKADCIKYLIHTHHSLQMGHLAPVSARRILLRICANLHQIYTQLEWPEEISRLQRYLVALAK